HPLKTGAMIYGPYILMPEGNYRVEFDLFAPPACRTPVQLEVAAADAASTSLAIGRFRTDQGRLHLDFQIGPLLAGRGHLEFRTVQTDGPSCAVLKRVNLSRLP